MSVAADFDSSKVPSVPLSRDGERKSIIAAKRITKAADTPIMQSEGAGKKTTRIQLSAFGNDNRFHISTMDDTCNPFKLLHRYRRYVPLETEEGRVYVNITSLSKRLLVSEESIRVAQSKGEGQLEKLVQEQIQFIVENKSIIDRYKFLSGKFDETDLVKGKGPWQSFKDFRKMLEGLKDEATPLWERTYIGWKDEHNVQRFFRYEADKVHASGGFSLVYKIHDIVTNLPFALRVPIYGDKETYASYANERANVKHLRDMGVTEGLPPGHFVEIIDKTGKKGSMFIGHFIEGGTLNQLILNKDYSDAIRAQHVHRMLHMLSEFHKRGVVHRDLKPSNIMMDPDRGPIFIDWDGSRRLKTEKAIPADFEVSGMSTFREEKARQRLEEIKTDALACFGRLRTLQQEKAGLEREITNARVEKQERLIGALEQQLKNKNQEIETHEKTINNLRDQMHKILKYQDFHAFREMAKMVLSRLPELIFEKVYSLEKVPQSYRNLIEKMDKVTHENFSEEVVNNFLREWEAAVKAPVK